jgi:hypothetical protein
MIFVRSEMTGKLMPMEPQPVAGAQFAIDLTGPEPMARFVPIGERAGALLYRSHFVTCPSAKAYRRRTA